MHVCVLILKSLPHGWKYRQAPTLNVDHNSFTLIGYKVLGHVSLELSRLLSVHVLEYSRTFSGLLYNSD